MSSCFLNNFLKILKEELGDDRLILTLLRDNLRIMKELLVDRGLMRDKDFDLIVFQEHAHYETKEGAIQDNSCWAVFPLWGDSEEVFLRFELLVTYENNKPLSLDCVVVYNNNEKKVKAMEYVSELNLRTRALRARNKEATKIALNLFFDSVEPDMAF